MRSLTTLGLLLLLFVGLSSPAAASPRHNDLLAIRAVSAPWLDDLVRAARALIGHVPPPVGLPEERILPVMDDLSRLFNTRTDEIQTILESNAARTGVSVPEQLASLELAFLTPRTSALTRARALADEIQDAWSILPEEAQSFVTDVSCHVGDELLSGEDWESILSHDSFGEFMADFVVGTFIPQEAYEQAAEGLAEIFEEPGQSNEVAALRITLWFGCQAA